MQPRAIPRHDVALAALVACAGLVTFAPALAGDFVYDDHRQIVGNPLVQDPRGWPALWTSGVWAGAGSGSSWYRPLMMSSFALDRALFGPSAGPAHAVSLALFGGVAVSAFALMRAAGAPRAVAFGAALLGAVHPIQAEAAAWISARCELLVAAFGLIALLLHDRALRAGTRFSERRDRIAGAGAFLLALCAKESAVAFIPLFFALDRLRGASWSPRDVARRHAPWLVATLAYAALRTHALGGVSGGIAGAVDPLGLVAFFGQGAARIVAPLALTISPPEPARAYGWVGAFVAIAGAGAGAVAWRARSPLLVALGLALGFLAIAALGAARLGEVADRYLLLPVFATAWLVAAGVEALRGPARRAGRIAIGALALACAALGATHVRSYASDERLWTDGFERNPRSVRAALNLGAVYLDRGDSQRAIEWLDRAAALAPNDLEVELNRAIAIEQQGDARTARARLDALADANPTFWPAALRAGHLALAARDWEAAGRRYEAVLRVYPLAAEAWAGLGVVRDHEGRRDDARRAIERSLSLDPGQENAPALRALLARLGS